jgi:uncharacterized protein YjbJ (UPF0337 family)
MKAAHELPTTRRGRRERITGRLRQRRYRQGNILFLRQKLRWHAGCNMLGVAPSARIDDQTRSSKMNWDRVEGNWKQMTGKVKQQWGKLTDDALTQINGQRDELVGKIQEAYGISRDEADRQVKEWEKLN